MLSYLKIALQGFLKFRKKRKNLTLVLTGAFFLIIFLISFFGTIFSNIEEYWGKMLVGNGAIVVTEYKDYKVFKPYRKEYCFSSADLDESLRKFNGINFSKRLRLFSLVEGYKSEKQLSMVLIGMVADKEQSIIPNIKLSEGRFPQNGKKEISLFLESAGNIEVGVGDTVIVYTRNVDGYMDYDLAAVVGILEPIKVQSFYGAGYVGYIPLSFATSLKGVGKDIVSEVVFSGGSFWSKLVLNCRIPAKYRVADMWESEEIPLTMMWIYGFLFWILIILIAGVVFSSIYHNVHLMIIERYREIGVFLAFGASPRWILKVWMGELLLYTLYCSIIGAICSTLLILGINSLGLYATSAEMEIYICTSQFIIRPLPVHYLYSFLILWMVVFTAAVPTILKGVNEGLIIKLFRK